MSLTIVYPSKSHSAYRIAAEIFSGLARKTAGEDSVIITDDEFRSYKAACGLTVLVGNDAVNSVTAELYLSGEIGSFGIRYCTDDYSLRSKRINGRSFLFLAGGRPRAAIYAVYRYFELFAGCRWFWDGDRLKKTPLVTENIDLTESPRFDYRGLRYFAHRSLHRFQAEHWSFEDWCTEIDWMLKKRLNLFMLRIGMDDVFQRAFPDVVRYPELDKLLPEAAGGYDDRSLFWSLQYRGELRKKILAYAFERDLMHPEDCGTMTHWYSRTPKDFLEKINPALLPQCSREYSNPTGRVWDIRDKNNFENYLRITDAYVENYGKPELFHTIGLGERLYSKDRDENRRMKLFVYRKIATQIKEKYPNAPLFIASWDLWMHFTPEEIRELVAELDPKQSVILDYTSDTTRDSYFAEWGIQNKFPWIFGIFSAYEPNSEIRGYYELTNERIKAAKSDPACQGAILWPELSHGDSFIIEYFAKNAWDSETLSIKEQTEKYCLDRYPAELVGTMTELWNDFMPIIALTAWSVDKTYQQNGNDIFPCLIYRADFSRQKAEFYKEKYEKSAQFLDTGAAILEKLAKISYNDEMTERDIFDIARTIIGRYLNHALLRAQYLYAASAPFSELEVCMNKGEELMQVFSDLLAKHKDYSLFATLEQLKTVTEVNPNFEPTFKRNAEDGYCRSYIYENAEHLYVPEIKLLYSEVKKAEREKREIDRGAIADGHSKIISRFFETPLADMQKTAPPLSETLVRAASIIRGL